MTEYDNRLNYEDEISGNECFLQALILSEGEKSMGLESCSRIVDMIHGILLEGPEHNDEDFYEFRNNVELYESEGNWSIEPVPSEFSLSDISFLPTGIDPESMSKGKKRAFYMEIDYYLDDFVRDIDINSVYSIDIRISPFYDEADLANLHKTIEYFTVDTLTEVFKEAFDETNINLMTHFDITDTPPDDSMFDQMGEVWEHDVDAWDMGLNTEHIKRD